MNVTRVVAIVSGARAQILRLTRARLQDLVVSDLAARAVIRYWRIQRRLQRPLWMRPRLPLRPSPALLGHALVLGLGFVLVSSALSDQVSPKFASAGTPSSGSLLWSASISAASAPDTEDVLPRVRPLIPRPAASPVTTPAPAATLSAPTSPPRTNPTPQTVAPPPGSSGSGVAAIYAAFGNSPGLSWALRVAKCESGYNPRAVNPSSGASGLFQFMPSTWNANFPGQNIWDPYAQARAALVFYNAGRQSAWTCR